jgi:hypothetical protein
MNRVKTIRVSPEELDLLKKYRDEEYDDGIPLGFVVRQLLDEVSSNE